MAATFAPRAPRVTLEKTRSPEYETRIVIRVPDAVLRAGYALASWAAVVVLLLVLDYLVLEAAK